MHDMADFYKTTLPTQFKLHPQSNSLLFHALNHTFVFSYLNKITYTYNFQRCNALLFFGYHGYHPRSPVTHRTAQVEFRPVFAKVRFFFVNFFLTTTLYYLLGLRTLPVFGYLPHHPALVWDCHLGLAYCYGTPSSCSHFRLIFSICNLIFLN